ncbi:MAG: hypothetical protein IIA02_17370, partial [Proteobacteria bacterium]|nr:hypothetical protein [Pseudomonadota bacterium]
MKTFRTTRRLTLLASCLVTMALHTPASAAETTVPDHDRALLREADEIAVSERLAEVSGLADGALAKEEFATAMSALAVAQAGGQLLRQRHRQL